MEDNVPLPTGTITFLFTDIEGSTRLLQYLEERYPAVVTQHHRLLRAAFQPVNGCEIEERGDGFFVVFARAADALAAAVAAQRAFAAHAWPEGAAVRVRMGLHTGEATLTPEGYVGLDVHRAARVSACGHGGQILLSQRAHDEVARALPARVSLRDMGTHRLKDLLQPEHLFQVVIEGLPTEFPPLKSLQAHPHNLPQQLTSFIGREQEMAAVQRRLATTRLLTLTGTGGTGKTRLALQVAAELLEEYRDGVWLVELAALTEAALVPQAVAGALHLREEAGRTLTETLADYLQRKQLLLLLDNCEHLIAPCAQLTETLLRACPEVRMLATSREALGILGEVAWPVPPLPVPDLEWLQRREDDPLATVFEYEGVRLFVERGTAVLPSFTVTRQNALALAEVCYRLDGIPLAIELAAARVKALPVERIAERLDDRFRLLTGGSRTALPRQQTLRALIDWSYELLSRAEQVLLRRLSVFAGGWTLEAAEAVCSGDGTGPVSTGGGPPDRGPVRGGAPESERESSGIEEWEVLDLLTALVEKSLVQYDAARDWYRLLETIRQYGAEQLRQAGEEEVWRQRHRDWYLGLAQQAREALKGPEQARWHQRLEEEHDNLRAALAWMLARGEARIGLQFAVGIWSFWDLRGYWTEGRERLTELLAATQSDRTVLRVRASIDASRLADQQGDYDAAWELSEGCLALARELGEPRATAAALLGMGNAAWSKGDLSRARSLYEEVLAIERAEGDSMGIAAALNNLAGVAYEQGDLQTARSLFEETLALRRPLGAQCGIATSLSNLGMVTQIGGDLAAAWELYEQALAIYRELGDRQNTAIVLDNQGTLRLAQGALEGARSLFEESLVIPREMEESRGIAQSLARLGMIAREQGEYKTAFRLSVESLVLNRELGSKMGMLDCLQDIAFVRVARPRHGGAGELARAARLLAAVEALQAARGAALSPIDRTDIDLAVGEIRTALGEEGLAAALAEGRAMTLEQAVALAIEGGADEQPEQ
jgi:predicted ATPase/class 3 adenylate cyclase